MNSEFGLPITITNANINNLKNLTFDIPTGCVVAITGVSGSGKTSLLFDVIGQSRKMKKPNGCDAIIGLDQFGELIEVTQTPVSTSQVSNTATYTGIFDRIRDLFAQTGEAKAKSLKKNHFSFNVKGGRCESCQGQGRVRISLDFVSDVWVGCDECKGKRYKEEILSCSYEGKNIFDVLEMTIEKAMEFFHTTRDIKNRLAALRDTGLGYLKLGQSTDTLSGGELQRLKLAREMMKPDSGKILYLFDEPGTGLHFQDIEKLNKLFQKLAAQGHTLYIVEHDVDIILNADWVIDLGPGGGDKGGEIVASGTPILLSENKKSLTGQALKKRLS